MLIVAKPSPVRVSEAGEGIGGDVFMVVRDASTRLKLYFVFGTVQLNDFWILADSGSARILISEDTFMKLPFRPLLVDKSEVHAAGESG